MAINAKFIADFASFHDAVNRADANLKALDTSVTKVGNALGRLEDSFSGREIIAQARLVEEAYLRVGGASKLTAAEQERVNKVMNEALAKYKALGIEAPQSMRMTADETKRVEQATDAVRKSTFNWRTALLGAAGAFGIAFSVGALKQWVTATLDAASRVDDLSKKLGVSTDAVQRWEHAAKLSGGSIETVDRAVAFMNRTLSEGDKGTIKILGQLGLSFDAIRMMRPEDAFNAIAAAIGKTEDPMLKAEAATKLFSRSGQELLPALANGFSEAADSARIMSEETIRRLDAAGDAWTKLGNSATIVTGELIANALRVTSSWETFARGALAAFNPTYLTQYQKHLAETEAAARKLSEAQKEQGETARQAAVKAGIAEEERAAKAEKAAKEAEARTKKMQAEAEAQAKAFASLQDKLFGRDLIDKAAQYAKALGDVNNISRVTAETKKELNTIFGQAYERLVMLGNGASKAAEQYRMLRDMTVDWAAVSAKIASMPDPTAGMLAERQRKLIEVNRAILNENEGLTANAAYWQHAGEIADAELAKTRAAVETIAPAADRSGASILNSFNNTWMGVANGATQMASQIDRTLAAMAQTAAYRAAGIFVGLGPAEEINRRAMNMPRYESGGPVTRTGPIYAHAGEYVVPKGGQMGNTYNISIVANGEQDGRRAAEAFVSHLKRKGIRL